MSSRNASFTSSQSASFSSTSSSIKSGKRESPEDADDPNSPRRPSPAKRSRSLPKSQISTLNDLLPLYRSWYTPLMTSLNSIEDSSNQPKLLQKIQAIQENSRQVRADLSFVLAWVKNQPLTCGNQNQDQKSTSNLLPGSGDTPMIDAGIEPTAENKDISPTQERYLWSPQIVADEQKNIPFRRDKVFWSHRFYQKIDGDTRTSPDVRVCTTKTAADKYLDYFLSKDVVGFDMEWYMYAPGLFKPGYDVKKMVSLIQIASESRILLIHIAQFIGNKPTDLMPKNLVRLLEDPQIIKTGVGIRSDCTRLETHFGVVARGLFELSHLYKLVRFFRSRGKETLDVNDSEILDENETSKLENKMSETHIDEPEIQHKKEIKMETQAREYLPLPLYKGDVRTSSWHLRLNPEQIEYAASDAYAGYQLYRVLEKKRMELSPVPPRPLCVEHQTASGTILIGTGQTIEEFCFESNIRPGSKGDDKIPSTPHQPRPRPTKSASSPATVPIHPDMQEAANWTKNNLSQINADANRGLNQQLKPSHLKAYYLWHTLQLDLAAITQIWEVKDATIAGYVDKAVVWGNLTCDRNRFDELVCLVPRGYRARVFN